MKHAGCLKSAVLHHLQMMTVTMMILRARVTVMRLAAMRTHLSSTSSNSDLNCELQVAEQRLHADSIVSSGMYIELLVRQLLGRP